MRVLVTAASKHGGTRQIAEAIARVLVGRGIDAIVEAPEGVASVDGYDAVILGSGVYAGHWLKPATELVERVGASFREIPVWTFSSGPVGDPLKPEDDPLDVADILRATGAREHRLFPGRIDRDRLSFPERAIVRALRVPDGDYRDWAAVEAWATEIARTLGGG